MSSPWDKIPTPVPGGEGHKDKTPYDFSGMQERLMSRYEEIVTHPPAQVPPTVEKQEKAREDAPILQILFLEDLHSIDPALVPLEDIGQLLNEAAQKDAVTHKSGLRKLIVAFLKYRLLTGDVDGALQDASIYTRQMPAWAIQESLRDLYKMALRLGELSPETKVRFRDLALEKGVNSQRLEGIEGSHDRRRNTMLLAVCREYLVEIRSVRESGEKALALEMLAFGKRFAPLGFEEITREKKPERAKSSWGWIKEVPVEMGKRGSGFAKLARDERAEAKEKEISVACTTAKALNNEGKKQEARELLRKEIERWPRSVELLAQSFRFALEDKNEPLATDLLKQMSHVTEVAAWNIAKTLAPFEREFARVFGVVSPEAPNLMQTSKALSDFGARVPTDSVASSVTGYRAPASGNKRTRKKGDEPKDK